MTVAAESRAGTGFPFAAQARRLAAVGCAGAVVGLLVAFPGGRIVMRFLASLNTDDTGHITDDGFAVGELTLVGSAQLLLALIQFSMLGAAVFLLVRPLLLGPRWLRTATLAVGVATTMAAFLVRADSFDFLALEPRWLSIALFWLLPAVHVVVFATLAEHWLSEGSWFQQAPLASVRWALPVWLLGGIVLVLVVPLLAVVLVMLLFARRFPPPPALASTALWVGRLALVAIFAGAVADLASDTQQLLR